MRFQSFYWAGASISDEDRNTIEQLEDETQPIVAQQTALVLLLGSGSVATRGIALDFYSLANANLRFGNEPLLDAAIDDAARRCALGELASPPCEPEAGAGPKRGANHASALHALAFNADPSDATLVARAILENQDELVLAQAVIAAEPVLRGEPAHAALTEALLRLSRQSHLAPSTRSGAIAAIAASADEAVVPLLVAAMRDPDIAVAAAAARALLERDIERYRTPVTALASSWRTGELPPFDVHEVHRLLEE